MRLRQKRGLFRGARMVSERRVNRRNFLQTGVIATTGLIFASTGPPAAARPYAPSQRRKPFEFEEATIPQLQAAIQSGKESAVSLAKKYLQRIAEVDRGEFGVNSVIELNPDALAIARQLDKERKGKGARGLLH